MIAKLIAFAFLCSSSFADSNISQYRKLHGEAWRGGGVCRHAAALVRRAATNNGTLAKVLLFTVKQPSQYMFHVVPVVFDNGRWHAIETSGGITRSKKWDGQLDASWFEKIRPGRDLDRYVGEEPDMLIDRSYVEYQEIISSKKPKLY